MRIFIDAGHGGANPGAVSPFSGLRESNVNLDVALRLGRILQNQGQTINFSRTTDVAVGITRRAEMANDWGADLFVSIHCNASVSPELNGTETLVYRAGTRAYALAENIQQQLIALTGLVDRGVQIRPDLGVLRLTNMPAVLVELAFLSNQYESALLGTESFRQTSADGISNGINAFIY